MSLALLGTSCQQQQPAKEHASTVNVRWTKEPNSLAPFEAGGQVAIDALTLLTPSLLQADVTTHKMQPYLAGALPLTTRRGDSLSVLTFELRPEARWSTGKPVLATDVAFTFKLLYNPGLPVERGRGELNFVKDIELDTRNPRRFHMVCYGHSPAYAWAIGDVPIVAESGLDAPQALRAFSIPALRTLSPAARTVMGTIADRYRAANLARNPGAVPLCGPYELKAWETDVALRFQRRSNWWGEQLGDQLSYLAAKPQNINYKIIPTDNSAVLALRQGAIDIYPNVPATVFAGLQQNAHATKQLHFEKTLTHDLLYMGFNTGRPSLADAGTRRALARLVDAAKLAKISEGVVTVGLISPAERGRYNDSLTVPSFQPDTAAVLLKKAGWVRNPTGWVRGGQTLILRLRYRSGDMTNDLIGLQIASAARQIGVGVTLMPTESSVLFTSLREGDFDCFVQLLRGNPFRFDFTPILGKAEIGHGNIVRLNNAQIEHLLPLLAGVQDSTQERRLLRKFQAVMQQQMPLVPIFFLVNRLAVNRQLTGLHVNDLRPGYLVNTCQWRNELVAIGKGSGAKSVLK